MSYATLLIPGISATTQEAIPVEDVVGQPGPVRGHRVLAGHCPDHHRMVVGSAVSHHPDGPNGTQQHGNTCHSSPPRPA
jgi:hypothetical protein